MEFRKVEQPCPNCKEYGYYSHMYKAYCSFCSFPLKKRLSLDCLMPKFSTDQHWFFIVSRIARKVFSLALFSIFSLFMINHFMWIGVLIVSIVGLLLIIRNVKRADTVWDLLGLPL